MEGQTEFGPAFVLGCTCDHFVKDHWAKGCHGLQGTCHCDARLFYKMGNGEYASIKAKAMTRDDMVESRDELAARLSDLNNDIRHKIRLDARKGIIRVGPM